MANNDDRKSTKDIAGKDVTPDVVPEPQAEGVVTPVAVAGEDQKADGKGLETKLASAIKAQGVDKAEVWSGDDNGLLYARLTKNGVERLLSVDKDEVEEDATEQAKLLVAQADMVDRKETKESK